MKSWVIILSAVLILSSCAVTQLDSGKSSNNPGGNTPYEPGGYGWNLVWSDEFDGTNIDTSNWAFDIGTGTGGWGNNELEYYTSSESNAFISNGCLIIRALQDTSYGTAYTSARLKTHGKHIWAYGKFVARIKLPYGQGIWPSFWMLGDNYNGANWPDCGEIVIGDMYGGAGESNKTVYSSLYWKNFAYIDEFRSHTNIGEPLNSAFHLYETEWNSNTIISKIDGKPYLYVDISTSDYSAFRSAFFIILNIAVGGNWAGSPDGSTVFPQTMEVDWVRVYQKTVSVPTINITYPQDSTTVYGSFPVMGVSAGSNGIKYTFLSVDHSSFSPLSDPTNWSQNLNLSSGPHNLRVYTVDVSDQASTTYEMNVTVTWEKPRVTFVSLPDYYSNTKVYGTVSGVSPSLYKISLWLFAWLFWYPKPTYESPYTAIQNDGSWGSYYISGGVDGAADNFVAYLVPSYMPVFAGDAIREEISNYIVTYGSFNRGDLIGPSNVHFIYPTNGETLLGRLHTHTFSGSFEDNIGGGMVYYSINGSAYIGTPLGLDDNNLHFTNWSVDKILADGSNTLSVYVSDDGYRCSSTNQLTVFYINDDTPPSLQVTSPLNNERYPWPGSVTLSGTANDLHGVLSVYLQMDNLGYFKANGTTNWNLVWPFLGSGVHTLRYFGVDIVTNVSSTNTITFFVD